VALIDPLDSIEHLASLAGLESKRQDKTIVFSFELSGDRHQSVYLSCLPPTDEHHHRIVFLSPCQRLGGGFMSGLSKANATKLLRHNAALPGGHFCLLKMGNEELLCVRSVQVLEHLSVQEFKDHCKEICNVADDWEQQLGRDDF
jgi:hypothetical protein